MAEPEPWRKTGRKAGEEHWLGLTPSAVVEVSLYDDAGRQQGRGVVKLQHRAIEDEASFWPLKTDITSGGYKIITPRR